jgi:hypothetical protein
MSAIAAAKFVMAGWVLLAASAALATEAFKMLSGSQIRARLAGMEVTDEVHWRDYYLRDGSFKSRSMGLTRVGKWRAEGDELCLDLEDQADSGCYEVWLDFLVIVPLIGQFERPRALPFSINQKVLQPNPAETIGRGM